jgi:hypothetical protein
VATINGGERPEGAGCFLRVSAFDPKQSSRGNLRNAESYFGLLQRDYRRPNTSIRSVVDEPQHDLFPPNVVETLKQFGTLQPLRDKLLSTEPQQALVPVPCHRQGKFARRRSGGTGRTDNAKRGKEWFHGPTLINVMSPFHS